MRSDQRELSAAQNGSAEMNTPEDVYGREVVATRFFAASPATLFALWADPPR